MKTYKTIISFQARYDIPREEMTVMLAAENRVDAIKQSIQSLEARLTPSYFETAFANGIHAVALLAYESSDADPATQLK